jgi:glycyl-tRNA synthetase beta chain
VSPGAVGDDSFAALAEHVASAARLAKADLASGVVQEFPVLQGRMGELYARAAGLPGEVAAAIGEQYLPLSALAPVPGTLPGALLAVADKIDNIVGAWVAGE